MKIFTHFNQINFLFPFAHAINFSTADEYGNVLPDCAIEKLT